MANLVNSTLLACAQTGAFAKVTGAGASETAFYLLQAAFYTPMNKISTLAFSKISSPSSSEESTRSALKKFLGAKKITSKKELKEVLATIGIGAACALPATLLTQDLHERLGYEGDRVEDSLSYHVGVAAAWSGGMALLSHLLGCLLEEENKG